MFEIGSRVRPCALDQFEVLGEGQINELARVGTRPYARVEFKRGRRAYYLSDLILILPRTPLQEAAVAYCDKELRRNVKR